jgi:MFS family permease
MEAAGHLMGIPFCLSVICFPIIGIILDKYGMRIHLLLTAGCMLCITLILLIFVYPIVPLILLGLSYSLFGAIVWSSVPYIVEKKITGTAYGIQTSVQNFGLTVVPVIVAAIRSATHGYTFVLVFLASMAAVGVVLAILMQFTNIQSERKDFRCG